MTKEQNEIIEKLEELVLEIHRNASRLDSTLQMIRCDAHRSEDFGEIRRKELNMAILHYAQRREDTKKVLDYDDLDEREAELWKELKATCKEGS